MMLAITRALAAMSPRRTAIALGLALGGAAIEGAGLLLLVPILTDMMLLTITRRRTIFLRLLLLITMHRWGWRRITTM